MRVFKSREFARFSQKAAIPDASLCRAIAEIRSGIVDANLGGGVYKQRVRRVGGGKSGGFRTIILIRLLEVAIFIEGFSKSDRSNISSDELEAFRAITKGLLIDDGLIAAALKAGKLIEVNCEEADKVR